MSLSSKLTSIITREILLKQILEYFKKAVSCDNDDVLTYQIGPLDVIDLPYEIAPLMNLVEIVPYIKGVNTVNGEVTVGWNFFVRGTHRLDLGATKFENIEKMMMALKDGQRTGYPSKTISKLRVKDIINFIIEIIKKYDVEIDLDTKRAERNFYSQVGDKFIKSISTPGASGKMFIQNRFVN